MKDQRSPSPSFTQASTSSTLITPSRTSRKASATSAACNRFSTKPRVSFSATTGTWPTPSISARVRATTAGSVHGAPTNSTSGTR
jgi:hypothetical protein